MVAAIGIFALIALGIHAGADRIDDRVFTALNFVDGWLDAASTWAIARAGGDEAQIHAAVEWIDLDSKMAGARYVALGLELAATVLLALPFFRRRPKPVALRLVFLRTSRDPTVLRFALPAAVACGVVAGVVFVSREMLAGAHGAAMGLGVPEWVAGWLARFAGLAAFFACGALLAMRATKIALDRAESVARDDLLKAAPMRTRRFRGMWTALLPLPIAAIAFVEASPVLETMRALLAP